MATEKKEVKVTKVKLLDGREAEFTGEKRLLKTSLQNPDGSLQVRLDFVNGETRLHTLRPDMVAQYALHGAEQKLGDEIAGIKGIDDAVEAVDQLMLRLDTGPDGWLKERDSSGMAGASILAKALVKVTGQDIVTVRKYLAGLDTKTKLAMRLDPSVSPTIKQLEQEALERAAAAGKDEPKIDVAGVLANLKAGGVPPAPAQAPAVDPAPATV